MIIKNNKRLLTISQLADFLSTSITHIRALVFKKNIPFKKVGRLIRFDKDEIEEWLSKNSETREQL